MNTELKCTKCGVWQSVDEFHRDPTQATGRRCQCRTCANEAKKYYNARQRSDYASHRKEPQMVRLEANRAETLAAAKAWRGPVTTGPLVPALGMPVVGMREAA